jgi:hypothetical protein
MKDFDLEHWWRVLAAAGIAITVASIAVKFAPTILIGLGVLSVGIAEWMQHPQFQFPAGQSIFDRGVVTTNPRIQKPSALAVEVLGGILSVAGLVKLFLA